MEYAQITAKGKVTSKSENNRTIGLQANYGKVKVTSKPCQSRTIFVVPQLVVYVASTTRIQTTTKSHVPTYTRWVLGMGMGILYTNVCFTVLLNGIQKSTPNQSHNIPNPIIILCFLMPFKLSPKYRESRAIK